MPETGSNLDIRENGNLSIQLSLDGQIFCFEQTGPHEVIVDTPYVTLLPSGSGIDPKSCLAAEGLICSSDESIRTENITDSLTAVMAFPSEAERECLRRVAEASFSSYLGKAVRRALDGGKRTTAVLLTGHTANIAVSCGGVLKYAQCIPSVQTDDIVYCLAVLEKEIGALSGGTVVLIGKRAEDMRKVLNRYARKITCE